MVGKHIPTFGDFLNRKSVNESVGVRNGTPQLKDLVDRKIYIVIGSSTIGGIFTEDEIEQAISKTIEHNLFDSEFYYNWTDNGDKYKKAFSDTLANLLKDVDETLKELFIIKDNKLTFMMSRAERDMWIDNWFKTNKSISQTLRKEYYDYRKEYANVELK